MDEGKHYDFLEYSIHEFMRSFPRKKINKIAVHNGDDHYLLVFIDDYDGITGRDYFHISIGEKVELWKQDKIGLGLFKSFKFDGDQRVLKENILGFASNFYKANIIEGC